MHTSLGLLAVVSLLALILGMNVGRLRGKHGVYIGAGDNAEVFKAQRAHGNLIEWAPFVVMLVAGMEYLGADKLTLIIIADLFIVARILHAIGIIRDADKPGALRVIGALGNVTALVWASVYVLTHIDWPI